MVQVEAERVRKFEAGTSIVDQEMADAGKATKILNCLAKRWSEKWS
jgi:hypothetical protein